MKLRIFIGLLLFVSLGTSAQNLDPLWDIWKHEHGATIEEFINNDGEVNYYLTWSSSAYSNWDHDIYSQIIEFDRTGKINTVKSKVRYIHKWEAQEPISTAINPKSNIIFSIWEDGADSQIPDEAVNVHGQLHNPDGTIIKEDWLIAGGPDAQHSAVAGHISNKFLAIYGDDYQGNGGTIKIITIDDISGDVLDTIYPTPNADYTWWPVVTSNTSHTRALTIYQKEIDSLAGSIIYEGSTGVVTSPMTTYLTDITFVNQQVNWLEKLSCFVVIAKTKDFDKSKLCMIDTLGNKFYSTEVNFGITPEGKPAIKWNETLGGYYYLYQTGDNDLNVLTIKDNDIQVSHKINGDDDVVLKNITWNNTGIWSTFAKDIDGNDTWDNMHIAFFLMGNYSNDNATLIPVRLTNSDFNIIPDTTSSNLPDNIEEEIDIYPNPVSGNDWINISFPSGISKVSSITITDIQGRIVQSMNSETAGTIRLYLNNIQGIYFIRILLDEKVYIQKIIVD